MKVLNMIAAALVVIGALNWGLWGFFQFDLVAWLCKGNTNQFARTIYGLVGIAGLWSLRRCWKLCSSGCDCGCSSCGTKGKGGKNSGCCK